MGTGLSERLNLERAAKGQETGSAAKLEWLLWVRSRILLWSERQ